MKKKLYNLICFVFLGLGLMISTSVSAAGMQSSLIVSKSKIKASETFTVAVNVSGLTNGLASADYRIGYDKDNFEYQDYVMGQGRLKGEALVNNDTTNSMVIVSYLDSQNGLNAISNGDVIVFTFKAKSNIENKKVDFTLTGGGYLDADANDLIGTTTGASVQLFVPSTNNNLASLKVDGVTLSPDFAEGVTEYRGTTSATSVTISATAADSKSTVTGTGTKNLSIGDNTFTITVTAESGKEKNYTIIITREDNRSSDSTLKSLTVDNGNINFKPEQTEYYDVVLPSNVSVFKLNAVANSDKAKIEYSPSQKSLTYGETDTIYVIVTAENGTYTRYSVTATRKDERSKNNNLKSLSINNQKINLTNSTSYTQTVNYDISKVDIKAEAEDEKARVEIKGDSNLKVGSNTVKVVVTAENNDIQTYTITILRKNQGGEINTLSNNSNLKSLKIKDVTFDFKKDKLDYSIEVGSHISTLDIQYEVEDSKATAVINKPSELNFGLNKITILVTAENGNTSTYTLNVTRKEKNYEVENNVDKIIAALKNKLDYDELKITVSSNENLIIPNKVVKEIIASNKKVTYVVKDNTKDNILYSFIVDGDLFDSYTGDIYYGLKTSDNQTTINSLLENRENQVVVFAAKNNFPEGTIFKIQLADSLKGKQNLQLYTYKSGDNELTLVQEKLSVESNHITLPVQEIKEYVVAVPAENVPNSPEPLPNDNDKDSSIIVYAVLGIGIVALIIILIILILKKKKNNPKKDSAVEIKHQQNNNVSDMNVNMESLNQPLATTESLLNQNPFSTTVPPIVNSGNVDVIDVIEEPTSKHEIEVLFGISAMNINDYLQQSPLSELKNSGINEGVVVVTLEPSSPLLPIGLKSGDVLLAVNGQKITNKEELRKLTSTMSHGMNVTLTYYQNGQNKTININI